MEFDLKTIGKRIYQSRIERNLTQEALAEQMDVSVQMISNLERGNKEIKVSNLLKLSSILRVSTDYLLTGQKATFADDIAKKLSLLSSDDLSLIETIAGRLLTKN